MRLATLLLLPLALAAPTHPSLDISASNADDAVDHLSEYFNLLADKVKRYKALDAAPECDVSQAVLPTGAFTLSPSPQPSPHIGGRGKQRARAGTNNSQQPRTPSPYLEREP